MATMEGLVLAGIDINDLSTFATEELTFTPAAKKPELIGNSSADGQVLTREPRSDNCSFELKIRVMPQASMDTALEQLGTLRDALQGAERAEGGVALEWTPAGSTRSYTAYVLIGETTAIPTVIEGDDAGWFLNAPVVGVRLTCAPFLYGEEETLLAATESGAEPQQEVTLEPIDGDVAATARLIVVEKSSQSRRFAEIGVDTPPEGAPGTLILAKDLIVTGFSGSSTTRSGAYSEEKVKRATAVSEPTVICGTGVISHIGTFRVKARVYDPSAEHLGRFRVSYRNGENPLTTLGWVQAVGETFSEIDLGEVTLEETDLGTQKAEIRIETKASTPTALDLNYLRLVPTERWVRARGLPALAPIQVVAYDTFIQEVAEGNLAGKTLGLGGTWAETGDAVRFTLRPGEDLARRKEKGDATYYEGAFAIAGSTEYTNSKASVDVTSSFAAGRWRGAFIRYASITKWLMAAVRDEGVTSTLTVLSNAGSTPAILGQATVPTIGTYRISIAADASGHWWAWAYDPSISNQPPAFLEGRSPVLATGGTLATGKGGFFDAETGSSEGERKYDNFSLTEMSAPNVVCYSGKQAEWGSDSFLRQDSSGTYYGEPPNRGGRLTLQPGGEAGLENRIVVALRRNDIVAETDGNVVDKHTLEVKVTPRFLAPR